MICAVEKEREPSYWSNIAWLLPLGSSDFWGRNSNADLQSAVNRIKISLYVDWLEVCDLALGLDNLVGLLKAAGEPTRFRLLALLAAGDLTVTDLTEILGHHSRAFRAT